MRSYPGLPSLPAVCQYYITVCVSSWNDGLDEHGLTPNEELLLSSSENTCVQVYVCVCGGGGGDTPNEEEGRCYVCLPTEEPHSQWACPAGCTRLVIDIQRSIIYGEIIIHDRRLAWTSQYCHCVCSHRYMNTRIRLYILW